MIIHSFSGVKGRLIFINRGCKSHLKNNTKAKWKLYLLGLFMGYLSVGLRLIFVHSQYFLNNDFSYLETYSLKVIALSCGLPEASCLEL